MIRRARVAGLLAAAIVVTACSSSGGGSATKHAASTTTVPAPVTTGAGGGSVNIGIICSTPSDAALAVVTAWISGNRAAARRCGAPGALDTLFARAAGPGGWILQRCAGTVCSFTHPAATLRLTMGGSDAAGWIVARVAFGR